MKTKYSVLYIVLYLIFTSSLFSQESEIASIPDYIPPSPNAAALGKYGEIPVGYYTGTPNINIPLGQVNGKRLSLPISLSYHAGGIKVDEIASQVGLGWSLNAGGVVTRTVRGLPDDAVNGYLTLCQNHNVCSNDDINIIADDLSLLDQVATGYLDVQPDMFSFNFGSYSGKFVFDLQGNAQIIPKQNLKIEKTNENGIGVFIITAPDGTTYDFTEIEFTLRSETSCNINSPDESTQIQHASSWFLTKIEDINGDVIHLSYNHYGEIFHPGNISESKYIPAWITYQNLNTLNAGTCSSVPNSGATQTCTNYYRSQGVHLDQIYSAYGSARFNYSGGREDLDGGVKLESIELIGAAGQALKSINFSYEYFDAGGIADSDIRKRLKLKSLSEYNGGVSKPPHQFTYLDESGNPDYNLPNRLSTKQDHWGYYNDNQSESILPSIDHIRLYDLGDRTSHSERTKAGLLQKIIYPTGGFTEFEFERHKAGAYISDWNLVCGIQSEPMSVEVKACNVGGNCLELPFCAPTDKCIENSNAHSFTVTNLTFAEVKWKAFNYGLLTQDADGNCEATDQTVNFQLSYILSTGETGTINNIGSPSYDWQFTTLELQAGDYTLSVEASANCDYGEMVIDWTNYTENCETTSTNIVNGRPIGGVRIKRIITDPVTGPSTEKSYDYNKVEIGVEGNLYNYSSGTLVSTPNYFGYYMTSNNCNPPQCWIGKLQSSSITTLGYSQGSHIVYTNVKESFSDSDASNEYVFSFAADNPNIHQPYGPGTSNDWLRGHLLQQISYNGGVIVKKIENNYNFRDQENLANNSKILGFNASRTILECQGTDPETYFTNTFYEKSYWMYLESSTETTYDEFGENPVSITTSYEYEPEYLNLISKAVSEQNGTAGISTSYKYVNEMLNGGASSCTSNVLEEMKERYMIGTPIIIEQSGSMIGGSETCYKLHNDFIVPEKIYAIEGTSGFDLQATLYYDDDDEYPDRMRKNHYDFDEEFEWQNGLLISKKYQSWVQSWTYGDNNRQLISATNIDGTKTSYSYDDLQRLSSVNVIGKNNALKSNTLTSYYYNPNKIVNTTNYGDGSETQISEQLFDGIGRPLATQRLNYTPNGGTAIMQSQTYDALGRTATVYTIGQGMLTYEYEDSPLARLKKIINPDQTKVSMEHFNNASGEVEGYPAGSLFKVRTTDENGNISESFTDILGRQAVARNFLSAEESADTYYSYNNFGNISSIKTPLGYFYNYTYDNKNRLSKKVIPGGGTYTYEYYPNDLLHKSVLSNGHITYNHYDSYDRLTAISLDGQESTNNIIENNYDLNHGNSQSAYFGKVGTERVRVLNTDDWLETKHTYDAFGRSFNQEVDNYIDGQDIISTVFDHADNLLSVSRAHTSSFGVPMTVHSYNQFDNAFRAKQMEHQIDNNPIVRINRLFYTNEDKLSAKQLFSDNGENTLLQQIDYAYNARGWLTSINEIAESQVGLEDIPICEVDDSDCIKCDYTQTFSLANNDALYAIYAMGGTLLDLPGYPYFIGGSNAELVADIEAWLIQNEFEFGGVEITQHYRDLIITIYESEVPFNYSLTYAYDGYAGERRTNLFEKSNCDGEEDPTILDEVCRKCISAGYDCTTCPLLIMNPETPCEDCNYTAEICAKCNAAGFDCATCPYTTAIIKGDKLSVTYSLPDLNNSNPNTSLLKIEERSKYYNHDGSSNSYTNATMAVVGQEALSQNTPTHYFEIDLSDTWINPATMDTVLETVQTAVVMELEIAGVASADVHNAVVEQIEKAVQENWSRAVFAGPLPQTESGGANPDLFALQLYYGNGHELIDAAPQFNGNISGMVWQTAGKAVQSYSFTYDPIDRILQGDYRERMGNEVSADNKYGVAMNYDLEGNILGLTRRGVAEICQDPYHPTTFAFDQIDDLSYFYDSQNHLKKIIEASNIEHGYKGEGGGYQYDAAGNVIYDHNKKMSISYNYLNLPEAISFESGESITFVYDARGNKLRKTGEDGITDYAGGIEYKNGVLEAVYHSEGRVAFDGEDYRYEYNLTDHLGNIRVVFADLNKDGCLQPFNESCGSTPSSENGTASYGEILQENHYYPFGMKMEGPWDGLVSTPENQYLYNGKELNGDFGLNWYSYGFRVYDPAIGRFPSIDPIADQFAHVSPFNYAENSPIANIDLWGLQKVNSIDGEQANKNKAKKFAPKLRPKSSPNFFKSFSKIRGSIAELLFEDGLSKEQKINAEISTAQRLKQIYQRELDGKEGEWDDSDVEYFYRVMSQKEYEATAGMLEHLKRGNGKYKGEGPTVSPTISYLINPKAFIWSQSNKYEILIVYQLPKGTRDYLDRISIREGTPNSTKLGIRLNLPVSKIEGGRQLRQMNFRFPGKSGSSHFNSKIIRQFKVDLKYIKPE